MRDFISARSAVNNVKYNSVRIIEIDPRLPK